MAAPITRRAVRGVRSARKMLVTGSGRRLGDAAAESAFFLALAILPMMLTTTALLRALRPLLGSDARPGVEHGLSRLLRIVLSSRGGSAADAAQHLLARTTGGLLTLGTAVSMVILTRAVRSILTGLHAVHASDARRTARQNRRRWADAAGLAALILVVGALILAMLVVGPLLGHADELSAGVGHALRLIWVIARWPVGLVAVYAIVLLIHAVGLREDERDTTRRTKLIGAAVSTMGVILANVLLPVYVHLASSVSSTLGTLGGGLILLIWCYLLAYSVLLGGQVPCRGT